MINNDEAVNGFYNPDYDLEFSIQLGSKLYPEYPCNSITQCFYHLRKALNLAYLPSTQYFITVVGI